MANQVFDMYYDEILKRMNYQNDPNAISLIKKYGGYNQLKAEIKQICAKTFKMENEAYMVDSTIRKQYNNTSSQPMYYDLRHRIMNTLATALG